MWGGWCRAADALKLPLFDDFSGPALSPAWYQDLSQGATLTTHEGRLDIRALANTYAHIRRPLNVDNFRATFALQPDWTQTWTPSLFVYWDPANWCQIGFRAGPFASPEPYCALMEQGVVTEAWGFLDRDPSGDRRYSVTQACMVDKSPELSGLAGKWQRLGVDVTSDRIYFLHSDDGGKTWTRYRWMPRRAPAMKNPPAQLIVGKGFSKPNDGLAAEFLKNDSHDRGGPVESKIDDVSVVALDEAAMRSTHHAPFPGRDTLGEAVLAKPGDPTFEAVKDTFPAMRFGRELVGVKDHPDDFGITPDGAVHFEKGYLYFEVGTPGARFGINGEEPAAHKRLAQGYMPIVQSEWTHDGLTWRQEAFGYSDGYSPDKPVYAYVRLTVENRGDAPRTVPVAARLNHADGSVADGGHPPAQWTLHVPARGSKSVAVKLPFGLVSRLDEPPPEEYDHLLAQTEQYWENLLNGAMTIRVPEARVQNAYRAWLAYNFLDVDKENGFYKPKDGSGFYNDVFGISAALYCRILDEYGYHADAARYLGSLMHFVQPDGSFIVNYGLPDVGAFLIALDDHYQVTRDREWLRSVSPAMLKMANWIVERRSRDRAAQSPDSLCYGMILERPYCDYPQKAYNFVSDLHLVAGLFSASASMRDLGMTQDAQRLRAEAEAYQADVLKVMTRSAINVDGLNVIPIFPQTHALLKAANYTAQDYYSLLCGQILEKGLIDPNGWQAKSIVAMMEQRGGLTMGVCRFQGGIDHAYTYGYWFNCLQRGEARKVLLGLYSSMAFGMTRDTYSGVEVTYCRTGMNMPTLPHLYSGTQQLRLLRAILAYEDGEDLVLCQAVPSAWLEDGKQIKVTGAGTRFGDLGLQIDSHINDGRITARIDPPTRTPPAAIRLRLRAPGGKTIRSATVDGKAAEVHADTVILKTPTSPVTVDVRFE